MSAGEQFLRRIKMENGPNFLFSTVPRGHSLKVGTPTLFKDKLYKALIIHRKALKTTGMLEKYFFFTSWVSTITSLIINSHPWENVYVCAGGGIRSKSHTSPMSNQ